MPEIRLATFFLELTDPLPYPNGLIQVFHLMDEPMPDLKEFEWHMTDGEPSNPTDFQGKLFVSLRFWTLERKVSAAHLWTATDEVVQRVMRDEMPKRDETVAPELVEHRTVVEATTPLRDDISDKDEVTQAYDRCERFLLYSVRACRAATGQEITMPRRESMPLFVPLVITKQDGEAQETRQVLPFRLNENLPVRSIEPLNSRTMNKLQVFLSNTLLNGHPFTLYTERSKGAWGLLRRFGDTSNAVIQAQLAFEILLDGLLTGLLWEEGADPVAAAEEVFVASLGKRIRTQYGPRLRGNWSTKDSGVMTDWARDVAHLRGRVVHAGYEPTRAEARLALETLSKVDEFVRERLSANAETYPRTALFLLGFPGLERLGALSPSIQRLIDDPTEPFWLGQFIRWRASLNEAR